MVHLRTGIMAELKEPPMMGACPHTHCFVTRGAIHYHAIASVVPRPRHSRDFTADVPYESAYHIENYDMFLSPIGKGRGVILYTKKKLLAKLVTLDTDFNESIWCKIHLDKTDQMLLGCIYRSPNSTTANSEQLTTLINKLHKEKYSHLLVVGDFNYREINWIDNSTTVS